MKYVLFICLTILLFNCKNTDQAYIQTIIQEWTNKKSFSLTIFKQK